MKHFEPAPIRRRKVFPYPRKRDGRALGNRFSGGVGPEQQSAGAPQVVHIRGITHRETASMDRAEGMKSGARQDFATQRKPICRRRKLVLPAASAQYVLATNGAFARRTS